MCVSLFWEPLIAVGPFKFGTSIQQYIEMYSLQFVDDTDEVDCWLTYITPDKTTYIYAEGENIVSIACYECLFYQDQNLIGLSVSEIRKLLGNEDEIGEVVGGGIPIEYFSLGLQLWVQEEFVTDVTCYSTIEN
jgi:hypothetical protein